MEQDKIIPVIKPDRAHRSAARGRLADLLIAGLAYIGAALSLIVSAVFFAGFALNDAEFGELVSAVLFTLLLGSFAIIPSLLIGRFAYKGYRYGLSKRAASICLFLILPWIILSITVLSHTPLPAYMAAIALLISALIALWALISLVLPTDVMSETSQTSDIL